MTANKPVTASSHTRRRRRLGMLALTLAVLFAALAAPGALAAPKGIKTSKWKGYERHDFNVAGRGALLVLPKDPAPGKPWIWRTEFFGVAAQADVALLDKGFHVAYVSMGGLFGAPVALDIMDEYYVYVVKHYGLSPKTVLEGFSRGGLYAFNWAARRPGLVACIYADAPVCDFKSWPGGAGRSRYSHREWMNVLKAYGMSNKEARAYKFNPVDNLQPLADADIPILCVIGDRHDWIVPIEENALLVEKRYKKLGGEIKVIRKPKCGHRPHSLKDPKPIVDFVVKHAAKTAAESAGKSAKWKSVEELPTPPKAWDTPPPTRTSDRFKLKDLPAELKGLTCVTKPRGSSSRPGAGFKFAVNEPAEVFIAVHNRGDYTPPAPWKKTDLKVTWERGDDTVYKRRVDAGTVKVPPHTGKEGSYYGFPHMAFVKGSSRLSVGKAE